MNVFPFSSPRMTNPMENFANKISLSRMDITGSNNVGGAVSLPVDKESEEWGATEAFLQLVYRSGNLSLRSLWLVDNPVNLAKFERRCKGLTGVTPTVIASEALGDNLSLSDVCDKGFPDSPAGVRIQVGNVSLPSGFLDAGLDGTRKQGRGRRVYECLIAKAAVGRSFIVKEPESSDDNILGDLAKEFDSVLIRPSESDLEKQALTVTSGSPPTVSRGYLPPHTFCQTYVLRDGSQVLPLFVCRFEVDSDKDEPLALAPCQSCEENPATIWCAADSAALCPECDEVHHAVNHLTQRHIRVPINERPRPAGPCCHRADRGAELWNEAMGIAIAGETQKEHFPNAVFEDIKDAYKTSIRVARREDEGLEDLKLKILSQIKAQDEAMQSLERMFEDAEESCYRKIGDVLKKALLLTENRTAGLLREEQELKVKLEFINWAEDLLQPFAHLVPPAEWLELWLSLYRQSRTYLLTSDPSDHPRSQLEGEIRIKGQLQVKDFESSKVVVQSS
jgi:hypothetical protein